MLYIMTTSLCLVLLLVTARTGAEHIVHDNTEDKTNDGQDNDVATDTIITKVNNTRDENHPMLTLLNTAPHSMSIMIKPKDFKENTMIRLLYERVSRNKGPFMLHLDDPVIEFIPLETRAQIYTLAELPMGKYIVCGEAQINGEVFQSNCFETSINRLDNNSEYLKTVLCWSRIS